MGDWVKTPLHHALEPHMSKLAAEAFEKLRIAEYDRRHTADCQFPDFLGRLSSGPVDPEEGDSVF